MKMAARHHILILVLITIAAILKWEFITGASPTFDEPYHLFRGVYFKQHHVWPEDDVHPSLIPWLIARLSPALADFRDAAKFSHDKTEFTGPYQYRMDHFSNLDSDRVVQRARIAFQPFWFFAAALVAALAFLVLRLPPWGALCAVSFFLLEPSFLAYSSVLGSDFALLFFILLGIACASVSRARATSALGAAAILAFSLAWATKLSAVLAVFPIALGIAVGRLSKKTLGFWALGAPIGLGLGLWLGGWDTVSPLLRNATSRLSFLDGVTYAQTPSAYFLQALLCKTSLAFTALSAIAAYQAFVAKRYGWRGIAAGTGLIAALLFSGLVLPGLGIRLVLPLLLTAVFALASVVRSRAMALGLILLLTVESVWNHDRLMAYQNPVAGTERRLLDSNCDWGQGLKQLASWWRETPRSEPLALALFGGTPPELYGITEYRSLPSFPELSGGKPLVGGNFSGFVAVSRNFLDGYIVYDRNLLALRARAPLHCFGGALCVFDVR